MVAIAQKFIAMAKTTMGLKVTVNVMNKIDITGKKVAADFLKSMRIVFDKDLLR